MSEQHYKKKPTCPYCDEEIDEWWEFVNMDEECQEIDCPFCEKTYNVNVMQEIDFTSTCGGEHDYKDSGTEAHPDKVTCEICGDVNFKKYLEKKEKRRAKNT